MINDGNGGFKGVKEKPDEAFDVYIELYQSMVSSVHTSLSQ